MLRVICWLSCGFLKLGPDWAKKHPYSATNPEDVPCVPMTSRRFWREFANRNAGG
jgi:hypothetical protein